MVDFLLSAARGSEYPSTLWAGSSPRRSAQKGKIICCNGKCPLLQREVSRYSYKHHLKGPAQGDGSKKLAEQDLHICKKWEKLLEYP